MHVFRSVLTQHLLKSRANSQFDRLRDVLLNLLSEFRRNLACAFASVADSTSSRNTSSVARVAAGGAYEIGKGISTSQFLISELLFQLNVAHF